MSESLLRAIFAVLAIISLNAILSTVIALTQLNVVNSDDTFWGIMERGGRPALVVISVVEGGVGEKAGIRVGDEVLAIDGREVNPALNAAQDVLNAASADHPVSYVVARDGRIVNLTISLVRQIRFVQFVAPVFAFLWLLIGTLVVLAKPRGRIQRLFFATSALVVFAFTQPLFFSSNEGSPLGVVIRLLWGLFGVLFFVAWVRFCTVFPIDQNIFITRGRKLTLYSAVIAYVGLIVVVTVAQIFVPTISPQQVQTLFAGVMAYFALFLALGYFGAGTFFLYRGYRDMPANADRRPMRVILVGTVMAGLALLYLIVLQTTIKLKTLSYIINPQLLLPILLLIALPISFGYAIFKYQVMDFRRLIRTTIIYTLTMGLVAAIYLAVAYGVGQAFGSLTTEDVRGPVGVIAFVLFVMFFEPMKRRIQTLIENRFFPQRRDYSANLASFTSDLAETVGTHGVAELIARTLRSTLNLEGVVVMLEDPINHEIRVVARDCSFGLVYVNEEGVAALRRLLRQHHSMVSLETVAEPDLDTLQNYFSYASGLYAQGNVVGAILLSRPVNDEPLSGSQTPFISSIVSQGASALEVARLYEQEIARQRLQEELSTARRIQEGLLPTEMPTVPGISISAISRPAQAVGGDYYDVIALDDDRFLIIIADVSGKGLPASLYMAEFHGMVHVVSGMEKTPKEMLSILNDHLFEVLKRGAFVSATMLLFDTKRKSITFARAGHTPILRANGSQLDALVPDGVALGLCARPLFDDLLQEYTVEYEPGETFVLYSDGVSEAMNGDREEFGDGRLHDVIASASDPTVDGLRDSIISQVERFRGQADQNDDITVVVVKVERSSEGARPVRTMEGRLAE